MISKIINGLGLKASWTPAEGLIQSQNIFCEKLGLKLDEVTDVCARKLRELDSETEFPPSFHLVAFTALAISGFKPKNVLEFGTFQGKATALLSSLFPDSKVFTVDLPENAPIFKFFHQKISPEQEKVEARLSRPNVERIRLNSAFVGGLKLPRFELIWVDAGHHFPEVAWDHAYAFNNILPGGWIFSDDIWAPSAKLVRLDPRNGQSFEMMEYLSKRSACQFHLVPKRPEKSNFMEEKFIGYAVF